MRTIDITDDTQIYSSTTTDGIETLVVQPPLDMGCCPPGTYKRLQGKWWMIATRTATSVTLERGRKPSFTPFKEVKECKPASLHGGEMRSCEECANYHFKGCMSPQ